MRIIGFVAAAALVAGFAGSALAQGPSAPEKLADPVQSKQVDGKYTEACTARVSKELCACVVAVANIQVNDLEERQVFYDYMMGDVEKAKAERASFPPDKVGKFNIALQKADSLLAEQCDKFKDLPKDGAPAAAPKAP